jgi:trigger factor
MADHDPSDPDQLDSPEKLLDEQEEKEEGEEEKPRLDLQTKIEPRSTCERHITVTVAPEDVKRYYQEQYSELMSSAHVPGFRPGHAPRKLIEARFRKDVKEQVKSKLLMDAIAQVSEDEELAAISEPDFKLDAVVLPEDGPLVFEFDLEVRPEFDLPQWKGLRLEKPVRQFSDADVDVALQNLLARYGSLTPKDDPAEKGDYVTTNLTFLHNGQQLASAKEEVIRIRPVLSFRDGKIVGFDKLMAGVRPGETRDGQAELSEDAPAVALRGARITARFDVLEVKKLVLPELTPQFLLDIGGFDSVAELRDAVLDNLQRRLEYHQYRHARDQISRLLLAHAHWDLPPALLQRQSQRELARAVMELQRSGFSENEIRGAENDLRQNSRASTARALKEHFIFERIAEEETIKETPEDYDREIELIAEQSGETPRRVRSRLEKGGGMDMLRNQVIERKVVDLILSHAEFQEIPYKPETTEAEAVDWSASGEQESTIPEITPEGSAPKPEAKPESGETKPQAGDVEQESGEAGQEGGQSASR